MTRILVKGCRAACALAVLILLSCTKEVTVDASTQILLTVNTSSEELKRSFTALRVTITRLEGNRWEPGSNKVFPREALSWPVDLPVTPGAKEDRAKQFQAVVEALDGDRPLAQSRAVTRFIPGSRRVLELWLEPCPGHEPGYVCDDADCHGVACRVCGPSGTCVPVGEQDPSTLPEQVDQTPQQPAKRDSGTERVVDASADARIRDAAVGARDAGTLGDVGAEGAVSTSCEEGLVRCTSTGSALRQRCVSAAWVDIEPCTAGSVCAEDAAASDYCREQLPVCAGNTGRAVCEGAFMHFCSDQGNVERSLECASQSHCQRGLESGKCATCLPGQFACAGNVLQACSADGTIFEARMTCSSEAECNATSGRCGDGCAAGSKVCEGDVLRTCKPDGSDFVDEQPCAAGLCDGPGKQCDVCVPDTKSCMGNAVRTCNATGQGYSSAPCTAPAGTCTGNGVCVECTATNACPPAANECLAAACDVAAGKCTSSPKRSGTACSAGVCDGAGRCVECTSREHCGSGEQCQQNRCVLQASCGDGVQNQTTEECDDGNSVRTDGCVNCKNAFCGDGQVRAGVESCDPVDPRWNKWTCSGTCTEQTIYTRCAGNADCVGVDEVCFLFVCSKPCPSTGTATGCPPAAQPTSSMCLFGNGLGTPGYCFATQCRTNADCSSKTTCFKGADGSSTTGYCTGCRSDSDCPGGRCETNGMDFGVCVP